MEIAALSTKHEEFIYTKIINCGSAIVTHVWNNKFGQLSTIQLATITPEAVAVATATARATALAAATAPWQWPRRWQCGKMPPATTTMTRTWLKQAMAWWARVMFCQLRRKILRKAVVQWPASQRAVWGPLARRVFHVVFMKLLLLMFFIIHFLFCCLLFVVVCLSFVVYEIALALFSVFLCLFFSLFGMCFAM